MLKESVLDKLRAVNESLAIVEKEKQAAITMDKEELVTPLLEQAKSIESGIVSKYNTQFADQLNELKSLKNKLTDELDTLKILESNEAWYPNGTTVWLWKHSGSPYSSNRPLVKTDQQGIVTVYDETQDLGYTRSSRWVKKGDIIVIKKKKDGSLGVKFEEISTYGSLNYKAKYWCAENDTPETNPVNIKEKEEEIQ